MKPTSVWKLRICYVGPPPTYKVRYHKNDIDNLTSMGMTTNKVESKMLVEAVTDLDLDS